MIKQRKITLIPLTVFYVSASVVCMARAVTCLALMMVNHMNKPNPESSVWFNVHVVSYLVSTYFNVTMGIFQVASIIELFFVLG